jgi:hypothetical protein
VVLSFNGAFSGKAYLSWKKGWNKIWQENF